ncbi:undecaprenyl pyrophosphate phosphatase UppP [Caballeronia udeis]|uniref:Undecaprenyl pyrophosphate phosphatase UppP n=1 Tax=Caballeronia udeis TaxID=1232866 RepID=A0ABW8MDC6_9BURK
MIGEIDIYGVYLPAVLVLMLVSYLFCLIVTRVFARVGLYRFIWHRSIFDLAIYVIVLGVVVIVSHRLLP